MVKTRRAAVFASDKLKIFQEQYFCASHPSLRMLLSNCQVSCESVADMRHRGSPPSRLLQCFGSSEDEEEADIFSGEQY